MADRFSRFNEDRDFQVTAAAPRAAPLGGRGAVGPPAAGGAWRVGRGGPRAGRGGHRAAGREQKERP